mmetsp:Transcript_9671/g.9386  ORF Transcript_9671/g.9386 Transcript_9671/m.9386 type:complete len:81 (+) Transcript_9671:492-734(+)
MFQLLSHFVGLLVELLDFKLSWPNISFQLLDLVVQDELELFQLLGLLLQIIDPLVLILDGGVPFLELPVLVGDLLPQVVG